MRSTDTCARTGEGYRATVAARASQAGGGVAAWCFASRQTLLTAVGAVLRTRPARQAVRHYGSD